MMDTLKRYRNWAIGLSAGMALLGLVLILWPETSAITVCWLLGALCLALGVCQIARYCRLGALGVLFRFDLGGGILGVLAGLLLLHPAGALMVLPVIGGFYILVEGVFTLQAAVELRRFGLPRWGLTLVPGAGVLLGLVVHALGDVRGLGVQVHADAAGVRVKAHTGLVVADVPDDPAGDGLVVRVGGGGDLAHDVHVVGPGRDLAGHVGLRVQGQDGVQDGVGDLVADLVGMAAGDGFGCENGFHGSSSSHGSGGPVPFLFRGVL